MSSITNEEPTRFEGITLQCGWGRLIFAHTFASPQDVANCVLQEQAGERDIAFYLTDPHIVLNTAPQALFLDPSHSYRIDFSNYKPREKPPNGFYIGDIERREDITAINRIYATLQMVSLDENYVWENRHNPNLRYRVARENTNGEIIGVAMGVDHCAYFADILNGSSLWSLAVDPQSEVPGVGEWLVRDLIEYFQQRGRSALDLSVLHTNESAIGLYNKLGFERVAVFAVKRCNPINEQLFVRQPTSPDFNPYAKIIIDEALRRGIEVEPLDPARGYFRLTLGGRSVACRESLTDQTSAIAMSRCDDKQLTSDLLAHQGLHVPEQIIAGDDTVNQEFLKRHSRIVVKPARGEQGRGISVDVRTMESMKDAIAHARKEHDIVLLEAFCSGKDLRIIVINQEVVAAAVRKPAEITGTGEHSIQALIERLSRRRKAATGGESQIPLDAETRRCVEEADYDMDSVLKVDERLQVRKTANLHTGGTIHDVTAKLNPVLRKAAVEAARAIEIPVVGLDLLVPDVTGNQYVIIEANERAGLANHEPAPTARKFIDFLFPQTVEP